MLTDDAGRVTPGAAVVDVVFVVVVFVVLVLVVVAFVVVILVVVAVAPRAPDAASKTMNEEVRDIMAEEVDTLVVDLKLP